MGRGKGKRQGPCDCTPPRRRLLKRTWQGEYVFWMSDGGQRKEASARGIQSAQQEENRGALIPPF